MLRSHLTSPPSYLLAATSPSLPSHSTTAGAGPRRTNNLPPPPVRRVTASPPAPSVPEPEDEGDLAEAMYEFKSAEDGDLPLRAKQVVVILEKVRPPHRSRSARS